MLSNRFGLHNFITSFNQATFRALIFNFSTKNEKPKIIDGKQNRFYFEKSILVDETIEDYKSMYNKIPVVVLLGWAGAQDNQLKKYSQIYSEMGYHTVRFSPSNELIFTKLKKHKSYAMEFLSLMKNEYKLDKNPILIHVTSNAGLFIVYLNSVRLLNEDSDAEKTFAFFNQNRKGLIFDSANGLTTDFFTFMKNANSIFEAQLKYKILSWPVGFLFAVLNQIFYSGDDNYFARYIQTYSTNDRKEVPTLFIYSKEDKIICHLKVAKNIEERRRNFPSQDITEFVFENGDHVKLLPKHRDKYLELVKEHLKKCNLQIEKI